MNSRLIVPALASLLVAGSTTAQSSQDRIALLEGASTNDLTLRVFLESKPKSNGATMLTKLEVLPIEITNRTEQMTFVPGRSRRAVRQGLVRIELPDGGKVFRYRRGGTRFGFLLIAPWGVPVVLQELAGIGVSGKDDPYTDRIGVSPDGRHASFATKAGTLWIARLDGGNFASTKSPIRRLTLPTGVAVQPFGMTVGNTHGFFVTDDDRIRRCPLADRNQPVDVTPPGTGMRLKDELAPSGDGTSVAFLFGPKAKFSIYLLRRTGAAVRLSPPAAKYEEPGYLPEFVGGPRLLLNHDGSRLMFIDATVRDEIYLLDTVGKEGTTHVTSDANFRPYIGVGVLPAFSASVLLLAVGNPNAHDWFAATSSKRVVSNLTLTGARKTPPFESGTLDPRFGFRAPDGSMITAERLANGSNRIRRIEPATGKSTILIGALRDRPEMSATLGGPPTVLLPGRSGDALVHMSAFLPMLFGPPGVAITTEAIAPSGTFSLFAATGSSVPTGPILPLIHIYGTGILALPPDARLRQLVLTRAGGAILNSATVRYLAPGVDVALASTAAIRIVLSGASN